MKLQHDEAHNTQMQKMTIRPARAADANVIKQMVRQERLDPTSLNWEHFLVAEQDETIIGIGQVKSYPGVNELGSLVTLPAYRGQGVARALMDALEAQAGYPMYLLCESKMEPYYQARGYKTIRWRDAPWFLKLKLLPTFLFRLFGIRVLVMRKPAA